MRSRKKSDQQPDWLSLTQPDDVTVESTLPFWAMTGHPSSTAFESHLHKSMELGISLSGTMERYLGRHVMTVRPGDIWLCAMWEPHAWRDTAGSRRRVLFYFLPEALWDPADPNPQWLRMFSAPPDHRPRVETAEAREAVLAIGQEVAEEARVQRPGWLRMAKLDLLRLLLMLERGWESPYARLDHIPISVSDFTRITPAVSLVNGNLGQRVSTARAAEACGLSTSRFHHLFRQTMGISYGRFSLRARVSAVAVRLTSTELPIEDLARDAGFVDGSHLHHVFLAHYGCTPAQYRRRSRGTDR